MKRWGSLVSSAAIVGLGATIRVHRSVADPYAKFNLRLLSAQTRNLIESARFMRLWQDLAFGVEMALAVRILAGAGPGAWARRRSDPVALGGVAAISLILVGGWLQRMLLNLLGFRLGGPSWNGPISTGLFIAASLVVGLSLVRPISDGGKPLTEAGSE